MKLTYRGRAYPDPEQARQHLKRVFVQEGVEVSDFDIVAEEVTPGAICPWDAWAEVDWPDVPLPRNLVRIG
jgi:hypothetical protein